MFMFMQTVHFSDENDPLFAGVFAADCRQLCDVYGLFDRKTFWSVGPAYYD